MNEYLLLDTNGHYYGHWFATTADCAVDQLKDDIQSRPMIYETTGFEVFKAHEMNDLNEVR